jgi:hypothetical protein
MRRSPVQFIRHSRSLRKTEHQFHQQSMRYMPKKIILLETSFQYESIGRTSMTYVISHIFLTKLMVKAFLKLRVCLIN